MSVAVRPACADDLDAVAALFDLYRQFYEYTPNLTAARRYVAERFERRESVLLLAETADRTVVGFCQMYPTFCSLRMAPTYVLYDLYVTAAARGTGAGRALMQAAERHARECGAARIELSTARTNTPARALYESLGWMRDETYLVYGRTL